MKILFFISSLLLLVFNIHAQQIDHKAKINIILTEFMNCIETKDSLKLHALFHKGPVTWVGVYKNSTQNERLKKDNSALNYKISDYKTWFKNVCKPEPRREVFNNVEVIEDGSIASVTFDYSFWVNGKKGNWGKEFWHLVNENGDWKIASVIFSIELEMYKNESQVLLDEENSPSNSVRMMANELIKVAKIPGLSIAIRKKNEIIFSEGFGYSDVEKKIPVTPLTQFRAASTSKVITTTGLAKMLHDGRIDIDALVQKYVPNYPLKEYPVTLKQLAGNISGMPHYLNTDRSENRYYSTITDALGVFSHHKLLFKPQTKYSYSSPGFVVLSAAMEGASGVSFLEYIQDKVLNPLDMKSTEADMTQYRMMPNLTKFYKKQNDNYVLINKPEERSDVWAPGGFVTTPTDLVNMTKAYSNGYLNRKTVETMFESQILETGEKIQVGIGWRRSFDMDGLNIIEHAGVAEGARTVICYFPEEEIAISVMTNTDWVSSIEETAHMFLAPFLKNKKDSSTHKGKYTIRTKTVQGGKVNEVKGTLIFHDGKGEIILENGTAYSVFHIYENVHALITNQGIYHLTININENKILYGKAIRYQSQLLVSPKSLEPFFSFVAE